MNANQLFNSRLHNISTAARIILGGTLSTADKGYMVYDTDLSSPYFWDGTQWLAAGGGGTGTLVALPFTTDHLATTNNQYVVGDLVWYLGNVYRCIANNDSLLPTSALYWTLVGAGFPLVQQPADWNSTSGNNQILNKPTIPASQIQSDWTQSNNAALDFIKNKPTIPTVGTWGALNYPTWVSGTPFVKMDAAGSFILDTNTYLTSIPTLQQVLTAGNSALNLSIALNQGSFYSNSLAESLQFFNPSYTGSKAHYLIIGNVGNNQYGVQWSKDNLASNTLTKILRPLYAVDQTNNIEYLLPDTNSGFFSVTLVSSVNGNIPDNFGNVTIPIGTGTVTGSGTINYIPKWTPTGTALGDSQIFDNGTNVGVGQASPSYKLDVNGEINTNNGIRIGTNGAKSGFYGGANRLLIWAGNAQIGEIGLAGANQNIYDFNHSIIPGTGVTGNQNSLNLSANVTAGGVGTNSVNVAQLNIAPSYVQAPSTGALGTGTLRGVYYHPTLTSLNTSPHIAWENTSGDIIHGNLATGGADEMVTVDTNGKLKKQTIPTGSSVGFEMNFLLMGA